MTEPKNKIDQLVVAVLTAVDERLEMIRGQFAQLVEAADKHTAALAAWQQVIEHQQAELALRHAELDMKLADLAHAAKRAGRDAPAAASAAAAAATAATAATPAPAPAPAPREVSEAAPPARTSDPVVATPPLRPSLVLDALTPLSPMPKLERTSPAVPAAQPDAAATNPADEALPAAEVDPPAAGTRAASTVDVDFAELVKLVERQLEGWSGAA